MSDRTPQNQDKYVLRLPDGMRGRIKHAADLNGRSMNAEIVAALEKEFPETGSPFELRAEVMKMVGALPNAASEQERRDINSDILVLLLKLEMAARQAGPQ